MDNIVPNLFLILFCITAVVFAVIIIDMLATTNVQEYNHCGEDGKGIVFEFKKSSLGIYSDNFRFMTPTEFETYCIKKVEGTK